MLQNTKQHNRVPLDLPITRSSVEKQRRQIQTTKRIIHTVLPISIEPLTVGWKVSFRVTLWIMRISAAAAIDRLFSFAYWFFVSPSNGVFASLRLKLVANISQGRLTFRLSQTAAVDPKLEGRLTFPKGGTNNCYEIVKLCTKKLRFFSQVGFDVQISPICRLLDVWMLRYFDGAVESQGWTRPLKW